MSSHLNLESLYRMLASPSLPPSLRSDEEQLGGFDPHAPAQRVDLSEAPPPSVEERPSSSLASALPSPLDPISNATPPEQESESYLAFLDQVDQQRAARSAPQGKRRRARGARSKPKAQGAQPPAQVTGQTPTDTQQSAQPKGDAGHANASNTKSAPPSKRRRRRRKPSSPKGD